MSRVEIAELRKVALRDFERNFIQERDRITTIFKNNIETLEEKFNEGVPISRSVYRRHVSTVACISTKTIDSIIKCLKDSNSRVDTLLRICAYYSVPFELLFVKNAFEDYKRGNKRGKILPRTIKHRIERTNIKDVYVYAEGQHGVLKIPEREDINFEIGTGFIFHNESNTNFKFGLYYDQKVDKTYIAYEKAANHDVILTIPIKVNQADFSEEIRDKNNVTTFLHIKIISREKFNITKIEI